MGVDKSAADGGPLYRRLVEDLRERIRSGRVAPGDRLPAERRLASEHDISLSTVRRALEELATGGLVERRHGAGTFVADPRARLQRPALVGVIVPSVNSFFAEIIQGIEDEIGENGHRLVLYNSHYDPQREQRYLEGLGKHQIDGLLIAPSLHSGDAGAYLRLLRDVRDRLPTVYVERRLPDDEAEFVSSDPVAGAALAVRHLSRLGHRRIALVGPTRSAPASAIYDGYRKGVLETGADDDAALAKRHFDWGRRGGADDDDIAELMAQPRPPTGILCMGDEYAFRVYYVLRRLGYRVPEDVALVAYDDVVAPLLEVPLTAVSPPKYEVGRQAAALLLRRLTQGDAAPIQQVLLKPRLVVRGTCGAAGPQPAVDAVGTAATDRAMAGASGGASGRASGG
jgi:DNA-binding LacI/PurR family transcriptional regulator